MCFNTNSILIIGGIIISNLMAWSKGELFTAITDVEPLLEVHKRITDDLEKYIYKEEERLNTLKSHLSIYKKENEVAMKDVPNYLGNPLNAFTLIKRLTVDLDYIEQNLATGTNTIEVIGALQCDRYNNSNGTVIMTTEIEYNKNVTMDKNTDVKYPTLEDLTGAAQALTRLQETYRLQVKDLAKGRLNGIIYSDAGRSAFETHTIPVSTISADDCFILGKALYEQGENAQALPWMMEAYQRIQKETHKTFTEVEVLDYISYIHYLLGDERKALEWINKLLALEPTHEKGLGNAQNYQRTVDEEDRKMKEQEDAKNTTLKEATETVEEDTESYEYKKKVYEALCRGEMDVPRDVARTLRCRYLTENHPFLRLAPIKMEYAFHNPDIIVFHGVMSDNEIEEIQAMAKPKFKRATVISKTGELVPAQYRISKSGWLANDEAPVIARVSRRIQDFTGLSLDTAELLQVVNYGIGGHYEPHYDHSLKTDSKFDDSQGNRIATVLFYMSDVPLGGATVFPMLGVRVLPIRGSAAFWLNLHPSGEGDLATFHAACPVLYGSKWVSNKWIHQVGQEFIKPCNLEYQEEGILTPIPPLVSRSSS